MIAKFLSATFFFMFATLHPGVQLTSGNNFDMSGAGDWVGTNLGGFDINTTVSGKMYALGNGGGDTPYLPGAVIGLTLGNRYHASFKARLRAGASTTIRAGSVVGSSANYFEFTPTSTEQKFEGIFIASTTIFYLGLPSAVGGFNGIAFEFDDVLVTQLDK